MPSTSPPSSPPSSPPPDERRTADRHNAVFPARIHRAEGEPRSAVIRNISTSGMRVLTRARLEVGEAVKVEMYLRGDSSPAAVTPSRVVRSERLDPSRADFWTHVAAMQFDEPLVGFDAEMKEIEQLLRSRGIE